MRRALGCIRPAASHPAGRTTGASADSGLRWRGSVLRRPGVSAAPGDADDRGAPMARAPRQRGGSRRHRVRERRCGQRTRIPSALAAAPIRPHGAHTGRRVRCRLRRRADRLRPGPARLARGRSSHPRRTPRLTARRSLASTPRPARAQLRGFWLTPRGGGRVSGVPPKIPAVVHGGRQVRRLVRVSRADSAGSR